MSKEKPLSEIARQAWLECPLDGDHWEAAASAVRKAVLEEAIVAIMKERGGFLSEEYAANQPLSSLSERFACDQCIKALKRLVDEAS
jgi:hypothetical protein